MERIRDALEEAIERRVRVQLLYDRQRDGVTSLHVVAPLDIRPGDTPRTTGRMYLWAWCFAESKPETHLLNRVRAVSPTGEAFDTDDILERWVRAGWPSPEPWVTPREWS